MPALVAGIHVVKPGKSKTWVAGPAPAMTTFLVIPVGMRGRRASPQKRIARAFPTDRAGRAVAADEGDLIAKRQKFVLDRGHQGCVVTAHNVGTPHRTAKQYIAHGGEAIIPVDEDDTAGRMAGAMQHIERQVADLDPVAVIEPAIRRGDTNPVHAELEAAGGQPVEQELVGPMRTLDRNAKIVLH